MKCKKGSSLILVIVCFAILTIFGAAILSLTVSAYKKTIVDNTAKRNQYFAEAGIDIAYGLIGKAVDEGIKSGNEAVAAYMKTLNDIIEDERSKVKNSNEKSEYLKDDGVTVNEEYIKLKQNEKFTEEYTKCVKDKIKEYSENKFKEIKEDKDLEFKNDNKPQVEIENKDIEFKETQINGETKKALKINLISTFQEPSTALKGNIKRTVCADYSILVPNYKDQYYIESKKVSLKKNPIWSKALCMDGNFVVKGPIDVQGDIYVKGNEETKETKDKSEVEKGININADKFDIKIRGNVCTDGNFRVTNLKDSDNFQVNNKEFKNISLEEESSLYSGNLVFEEGTSGIKFNVGGTVYTNNDLALNSSKTNINVEKGFYGLNDITRAASHEDKGKVSSSIFINTDDLGEKEGSTINIKNDLILMGTAYVKTDPAYQTGESISIKGNYIAYTEPLIKNDAKNRKGKSLNDDNVYFEYFDPLQLVSKFKKDEKGEDDNSDLLVEDKIDYFKYFNEEYQDKLKLGKGITIPKNYAGAGLLVSNGQIAEEHSVLGRQGDVKDKQRKYGTMVYAMGDATIDTSKNCTITNKLEGNPYDWGKVVKSVSTQIDFSSIKNVQDPKELEDIGSKLYLNSNENYIVVGKNPHNIVEGDIIDLPDGKGKVRQIKLPDGKGKGIIITGGNVYLAGDINFAGTIIAKGNIETIDDNEKHIEYDRHLVEKVIGFYYDEYFKDVFKNFSIDEDILENSSVGNNEKVETDVIRDKLIKLSAWRLDKKEKQPSQR